MLQATRLPKELQILVKKPEERSEAEKFILEKYDIKPDYKMNLHTLGVVEKIAHHLGEI